MFACRAVGCTFSSITSKGVWVHFTKKHTLAGTPVRCVHLACTFSCDDMKSLQSHEDSHGAIKEQREAEAKEGKVHLLCRTFGTTRSALRCKRAHEKSGNDGDEQERTATKITPKRPYVFIAADDWEVTDVVPFLNAHFETLIKNEEGVYVSGGFRTTMWATDQNVSNRLAKQEKAAILRIGRVYARALWDSCKKNCLYWQPESPQTTADGK